MTASSCIRSSISQNGGAGVKELLREMELVLTDLLQSGLDTGGPSAAPPPARTCPTVRGCGPAYGSGPADRTGDGADRPGPYAKKERSIPDGSPLPGCPLLALCREKLQEESIAQRWQQEMPGAVSPRAQEEQEATYEYDTGP